MNNTYIVLLLGLLVLAGCSAGTNQQEATVGWIGPLTGDAAVYGEARQESIELIETRVNEPLQLIYEDDKCDGSAASQAVNKLINIDGVSVIIGSTCSSATLAVADMAAQNEVVFVSPSASSPELTDYEWIFRTTPSDTYQGAFASELIENNGHQRLAVIYSNEEYGLGLSGVVQETFSGEIVAVESFTSGETDLRTQLTKLQSANPDAIFIASNSPDSSAAIFRQIEQLGIQAELYGPEALKSESIIEASAGAMEGFTVVTFPSGTDEYKQAFEQLHGHAPGIFAAQEYDAYTAVHKALATGARTGEEIRQALLDMRFEGVTGTIDFDENGDITGGYEVYTVQDGEFVAP